MRRTKPKLRMVRGGKRAGAPPAPKARLDPEGALIHSLSRLAKGALERDQQLDEITVLRAVMRFSASLAARVAREHGGDAEQFALACEQLYLEQEEALGPASPDSPEGAG